MLPLNVDIPAEILERLKLAKLITSKPIRAIAAEAFENWLRAQGITPDKLQRLKR